MKRTKAKTVIYNEDEKHAFVDENVKKNHELKEDERKDKRKKNK